MDSTDFKIIEILQNDGKISMQKVAKLLPRSVPATCERVRKLEDAQIITGYTARIDPEKIGRSINAYILMSCNIGELDDFLSFAHQEPRIVALHLLAGKFSAMLEVSCKDMKDYADLIHLLYPRGTTESYIRIETVKEATYGTDA